MNNTIQHPALRAAGRVDSVEVDELEFERRLNNEVKKRFERPMQKLETLIDVHRRYADQGRERIERREAERKLRVKDIEDDLDERSNAREEEIRQIRRSIEDDRKAASASIEEVNRQADEDIGALRRRVEASEAFVAAAAHDVTEARSAA